MEIATKASDCTGTLTWQLPEELKSVLEKLTEAQRAEIKLWIGLQLEGFVVAINGAMSGVPMATCLEEAITRLVIATIALTRINEPI